MSMTVVKPDSPADEYSGEDNERLSGRVGDLVEALRAVFGVEFTVYHGEDGRSLHLSEEQPRGDVAFRGELARAVANRAEPAFLGEVDPVLVFALPIPIDGQEVVVAVGSFVTHHPKEDEDLHEAAELLGLTQPQAAKWIGEQEPWSGRQLNAVGRTTLEKIAAEQRALRASAEIEKLSDNLASTYEEISVLYGVTQNLQLSSTDEDLGKLALEWLQDVIPAEGLAISHTPARTAEELAAEHQRKPVFVTAGECPVDADGFSELSQFIDLNSRSGPVVLNGRVTSGGDWKFSAIRQLIVVPLAQGEHLYGWMAAFNHHNAGEFGTVEASLMGSVGAILGVHSGNIELYRQQADFLAQMVRALTSAIDAKDPYTCGHSDRVARLSVRLGQQLGCDVETLNKLYMGGLLHDIGKIGIDDNVLRKPGRLTDAEFEHIKLHPELGYNILRDVKQLEDVLPIVLHHHESWDGSGYPHNLAGEQIPFLARIAAVADAFDAMSSDRPYRRGMPQEKVERIFREGAGRQWDAAVVEAFFTANADIHDIASEERANLALDVQQWT